MMPNPEQAMTNPNQTFANCLVNFATDIILNIKDCFQDTKSGLATLRKRMSKILIEYSENFENSTRSQLDNIMLSLGFIKLECYNKNDESLFDETLLNTLADILPVAANQMNNFFQRKVCTVRAISLFKLKAVEILPQNVNRLLFGNIQETSQDILVTNPSKNNIVMRKEPRRGRSSNEKTAKQPTKKNLRQTSVFQTIQNFDVRGRWLISYVSRRFASYGNSGTHQLYVYEENIFANLPALYQNHLGLNFGLDDNQYSTRRIVSISSKSTTNVFFLIGRSKVYSSRIFDEALVISSMIYEQNRWNVENGLQIAYTLVFPNDCRMFLYVPIYQYGYIYMIDQKKNAIPVLGFDEPTNAVFMPNDQNWSGVNINLTR